MKKIWQKPICVPLVKGIKPIETVFMYNSGKKDPPPWENPNPIYTGFFTRCKEFILRKQQKEVII